MKSIRKDSPTAVNASHFLNVIDAAAFAQALAQFVGVDAIEHVTDHVVLA